jgi:serine/threonine protein kinase
MAADFGEWVRGEALREGGQGWTYLTYRKGDEARKPFVLKVLKNKSNPARLKRFEREIEVGSRLRHPNVVRIEAEDIEREKPYVAMEFCEGGDLQSLHLSDLSLIDKLHLFNGICHGVAHIHDAGVIHRDLKPGNIFLREDRRTPVVGDLGLCLIAEEDERLTETTEAIGPRLFMAPELEDGRYEDARPVADIYSLGKILYWLVSNKRIFSREKQNEARFDLRTGQNNSSMAFVYDMLNGMVVNNPNERRYANATEVISDMDEIIERVANGSHAIDSAVPQSCSYCGKGTYQRVMWGNHQIQGWDQQRHYIGIDFMNVPARWLVFACDSCGNLQFFRGDMARQNPNAWQEGSRP